MSEGRDLNHYPIWDPRTRANPHPVYAEMRQHDPIYRALGPVTGNPIWFFTRYDDVVTVLKDQRFGKNARRGLPPEMAQRYLPAEPNPLFDAVEYHLLNMDAPDHTRLRALVHKAFTPRMVADLQPRIAQIAEDLLDAMATHGDQPFDLIDAFAYPLPITVIAEMLGVHPDDRDRFRDWTRALLFGTDEDRAGSAVMEFVMYMNALIDEREKVYKHDILSELVRAEEAGDSLDRMELLSMVFLLLVAGHETTVNLIGNGLLALLQHPEQRQKLLDDPGLMPGAIEEMLRYNGPVETPTLRFSFEDVAVNGVVIPQGEIVLPSLLAANRDPAIFERPDEFDITREPNRHVAFGAGIHYCLGAPLARMEGALALGALLRRYPGIALAAPLDSLIWNENLLLHGMKALPVRC